MRVVLKVTAAVHLPDNPVIAMSRQIIREAVGEIIADALANAEKDGFIHGMADHLFVAIRGVKVIDDYDEAQLQ